MPVQYLPEVIHVVPKTRYWLHQESDIKKPIKSSICVLHKWPKIYTHYFMSFLKLNNILVTFIDLNHYTFSHGLKNSQFSCPTEYKQLRDKTKFKIYGWNIFIWNNFKIIGMRFFNPNTWKELRDLFQHMHEHIFLV